MTSLLLWRWTDFQWSSWFSIGNSTGFSAFADLSRKSIHAACREYPITELAHRVLAERCSGHAVTVLPPILVLRVSRREPVSTVKLRLISE